MMIHVMKAAAAAAIALTLSATAGLAQESGQGAGAGEGEATTFDIDRNPDTGEAAFEDFNKGFDESGTYDAWDADRDGMLSRDEFNRGVFSSYDTDRNEALNEEEITGMQRDRLFADETVKAGNAPTATQD